MIIPVSFSFFYRQVELHGYNNADDWSVEEWRDTFVVAPSPTPALLDDFSVARFLERWFGEGPTVHHVHIYNSTGGTRILVYVTRKGSAIRSAVFLALKEEVERSA